MTNGTYTAEQFARLSNLFCYLSDDLELSYAELGDILYHHASPVVCDASGRKAAAVLAYLGLRSDNSRLAATDESIRQEMLDGEGALTLREGMEIDTEHE